VKGSPESNVGQGFSLASGSKPKGLPYKNFTQADGLDRENAGNFLFKGHHSA